MREFFNSLRFKIFIAVALLLLGLMLRAATSGSTAALPQKLLGAVVAPVQKLSAGISGAATDLLSGLVSYSSVKKENAQLKKEIQDLNSKMVDYDTAVLENKQYKEYLGLKQSNPDMKFVSAMVISRDSGQWFSSFTVDKGSVDGVKKNDTVITSDGVVGVVTNVMYTSSVVTTVLDTSVQVGSIVSRTADVCLSKGTSELLDKGELEFVNIPTDSEVAAGDIVVTSGIGGIYPKGLIIGTVQSVKLSSGGLYLCAVAKPIVNPSTVKDVFIVTDFKGKSND